MSQTNPADYAQHVARARALGFDPSRPEDLQRAAKRAKELRAVLARHDPNLFCSYVLRDEQTGKHIQQAPMHEEWHRLLSTHEKLVLWSHVEGGKTSQISVGRPLYELGHDPSLRVCIVSNTSDLAQKMTRQLGQYIDKSPELHEVFPHLVPTKDPSLPWKAKALTIDRPQGIGGKDPSIQATGVHGNVIGSRIDLLILDDVLDHENTHTPTPRDDVYRWIKSSLFSRLTARARIWIVGNAWHPDDAMHRLEREEGFLGRRFPVVDPSGHITWPERWPLARIENQRKTFGPLEYARQLLCQARDDASARFHREWVDKCIELGRGLPFCEHISDAVQFPYEDEDKQNAIEVIARLGGFGNFGVVTGVDLAVQRHAAADETVLFTMLVHPNGTRQVLNIRSGKWSGPEIIAQCRRTYLDFGGMFIVENNAAQDYIVQFLRNADFTLPVRGLTTGKNKAHPEFGVESIAAELEGGRWLIPNKKGVLHREVHKWVDELLYYDPKEHTGDRVMASWFAREGARMFTNPSNTVGVRVL